MTRVLGASVQLNGEASDVRVPRSRSNTCAVRHPFRRVARRRPGCERAAIARGARVWHLEGRLVAAAANSGQAEWLSTGRRLGAIGRCSQWWIGDWIRYGTARWGEKYAEAARVTGYDVASLRNMAWVAAQFDLSLRSDKLSWSHHVLLAPLDAGRAAALDRAGERGAALGGRPAARAARQGHGGGGEKAATGEGSREQGADVCPHCGHKLSESGD